MSEETMSSVPSPSEELTEEERRLVLAILSGIQLHVWANGQDSEVLESACRKLADRSGG
jgi:hypothetical protein